jgi:hypothetical protein
MIDIIQTVGDCLIKIPRKVLDNIADQNVLTKLKDVAFNES